MKNESTAYCKKMIHASKEKSIKATSVKIKKYYDGEVKNYESRLAELML